MYMINNYDDYTAGMKKSMQDKTWFVDKIKKTRTIVDYGCADGTLVEHISEAFPNVFQLIGLDNDPKMLDLAQERVGKKALFLEPEEYIKIGADPGSSCLNLGSVIHEIYSYCSEEEISRFWDFVFNTGFKYISIRDMGLSRIDSSNQASDAFSIVKKIHLSPYKDKWMEYCTLREDKPSYKRTIEFFLKYRYNTNWDRELAEKYFPLDTEELILMVPTEKYKIKMFDHYILPYHKDKIKEDFGIDFNVKTHYKMLLERV